MSRKKLETSQSAVEFALVLPVLLLIIFGALEMGHLIFVYATVLNASREAARYGAVSGLSDSGIVQYKDCTNIAKAATKLRFLANFTDSDVAIYYDQGPGTGVIGPCSSLNTPTQWAAIQTGSRIVVTVTSRYSLLLPLVPIPAFNIVSTSARTILGSISVVGDVAPPPSGGANPPTITSTTTDSGITPPSGPTAGNTVININGTNFSAASISVTDSAANCDVISPVLITCTTLAHAAGPVTITVTNADGNTSLGFTFVSAPTFTAPVPNYGPIAGGTSVTITGTDLQTATTVNFGGSFCTSVAASADGTQLTCTTAAHAAGAVSVVVTTAGGPATLNSAFTYLPPTPTISLLNPSFGPTAGGTNVILTGNYLSGGTVTFGGTAAACTVNSDTQITCSSPAHVTTVDLPVPVVVTTLGGLSNSLSFTYKPTPPTLTSLNQTAGPAAGGQSVIFTGANFVLGAGGTTSDIKFDTSAAISCTVTTQTKITCTTPAHAAGAVTVTATVTTVDGTTTQTFPYTYVAAPVFDATSPISPVNGLTTGSTSVTIKGTNLLGGTVTFGGAAAVCPTVTATQMICTTPAHLAGAVDVVVTTIGGTATQPAAYTYYPPPPTLTAISPADGPIAGGTSVTLTGTNLTGGTVTIGGSACTSVSVNADGTQLTCTTPPHVAGAVNVVVTTTTTPVLNQVTGTGIFTYRAAPTITTVNPASGPQSGNVSVTITGTNFVTGAGATTVWFGPKEATSTCTVNSTTQITCATIPSSASAPFTVDVVVTTGGGPATKTNGFTYNSMVTITSVNLASDHITKAYGLIAGGTSLEISGVNFVVGSTTVTIGGVAATCTTNSTVLITCASPVVTATGLADVVVTTPAGTGTKTGAFTYFKISPAVGAKDGILTINGAGLANATVAVVSNSNDSATCTSPTTTDTQITCTIPDEPHRTASNDNMTIKIFATTPTVRTFTLSGGFSY